MSTSGIPEALQMELAGQFAALTDQLQLFDETKVKIAREQKRPLAEHLPDYRAVARVSRLREARPRGHAAHPPDAPTLPRQCLEPPGKIED